jgi:hypothetical protein
MTQMFCNFFTKYEQNVDLKNVQEPDFWLKIDQNMTMLSVLIFFHRHYFFFWSNRNVVYVPKPIFLTTMTTFVSKKLLDTAI